MKNKKNSRFSPKIKVRKDYQKKNLKNPFFRQPKKNNGHSYKKLIVISFIVLFFVLVYLIFGARLWKIEKIEIVGLTRFDQSEIIRLVDEDKSQRTLFFFKRENIFLFKTNESAEKIRSSFNLASVNISKKLPDKIKIEISERPYSFVYQEKGISFFSSADKYLIKEAQINGADREEAMKYYLIENKNATSLVKDDKRLSIDDEYLDYIMRLKNELDKHQDLPVDRFIISDQYFNSVFVKIKDGPEIFINVKDDINAQIERLILVKNSKIKDNFSRLDYIDLRYGDKLYFSPENIIK